MTALIPGSSRAWPRHYLLAMCLTLLIIGLVHQTRAEEVGIDYTQFSLAELMDMDVVYGASKFEQKTLEAPSSITVVTAEDIESFGYTTLAEILGSVPGLYTSYDFNYDYIGIRGFGRPGDYNSRLLILVDGIRLNDNVYSSALVGNGFPLDIALIERVEIMRGPSSSLYGSSAVFGIVNIVTKQGHQIDGIEIQGMTGSFGRTFGRLSAGGQTDQGTSWLLSASTGRVDGQDRTFKEFADAAPGGVFQAGDRDEWTHLAANLSRNGFHFETLWGWRTKHVPTASWETIFNDSRAWTQDNQGFASGWYEGSLSANTTVLSRLSFNLSDYSGSYPYDYADEGEEPWIVINRDNSRGRWLTLENQITRRFSGGHTLATGFEWRRNLMQDQAVWDEAPDYWTYLNDRHENSNWGIYALGEYHLSTALLINGGVRYDDYPTFGGTLNPRLGIVVKPLAGSILKGLYGSAFRAPNAYELYYNDGGETTKDNPGLTPETIHTFEIIWDQRLNEQWHASISTFHYENSQLIEQFEDATDGLLVFKNSREVNSSGGEIALVGRQPNGWLERLSYSFQDTDYHGGQDLTNSPHNMLKAHLVAPMGSLDSTMGLEVLYQSQRLTVRGEKTTAFTLTNLTVNKALPRMGWVIKGGIYNLFDVAYGYPGGVEHLQDILMQDGRSYRFGITLSH